MGPICTGEKSFLSRIVAIMISLDGNYRLLSAGSVTQPSGLLGQPSRDILDRIAIESLVEVSGDVTDMRRGQDVIQRPERVIRRQRLDVEHVERRASDPAFTQNLDERRLVNDRAARGIDESGRWLHGLQLGRSDQPLTTNVARFIHGEFTPAQGELGNVK